MKYLLDVNVLVAYLIRSHPHHPSAKVWLEGKQVVLCPLTELGFLRVTTNRRAYGLPIAGVRESLKQFKEERKAEWIPDDLPALSSGTARTSEELTDSYLLDLAIKHGFKLATLDSGISHPSVELLPQVTS